MHTPANNTLLQARNVVQKHKAITRNHATDLVAALTPEQLVELIEIGVDAAGLPDADPSIRARIDAVLRANDPLARELHEKEVRAAAETNKRHAAEAALADSQAHNLALREELARLKSQDSTPPASSVSPLPVVGEGSGVRGPDSADRAAADDADPTDGDMEIPGRWPG